MVKLKFWESWETQTRTLYLTSLILFSVLLIGTLIFSFLGYYFLWEVPFEAATHSVKVVVRNLSHGYFNFPVDASALVYHYQPAISTIKTPLWVAIVWLSLLWVAFSLLLSVLSDIKNMIWFFVALTIGIFFIAYLKPENLEIFGRTDKLPLVFSLLIIVGLPTIWKFTNWRPMLLLRFALSLLVSGGVFVSWALGSVWPQTEWYFAQFAFLFPMFGVFVFGLLVSYEVPYRLLYLSLESQFGKGTRGLWNFVIIVAIYVGSLVLQFLNYNKILKFEVWAINPVLILSVAAISGIWGFADRRKSYAGVATFTQVGSFFYVGFGLFTFSAIFWALGSGSDSANIWINNAILTSQISGSAVFVLYVIGNFIGAIGRGIKIWPILFSPVHIPLWTIAPTALMISFLMMMGVQFAPVEKATSAYIAGKAEYYLMINEPEAAMAEYHYAKGFDGLAEKVNLNLGVMAAEKGDFVNAMVFFRRAQNRNPSPVAYTYAASMINQNPKSGTLEAIMVLRDSYPKIGRNSAIDLAMANAFAKTTFLDSTIYYCNLASKGTYANHAKVNLLSVAVRNSDNFDYIKALLPGNWMNENGRLNTEALASDPILLTNAWAGAVNGLSQVPTNVPKLDTSMRLTSEQVGVLYNSLLYRTDLTQAEVNILGELALHPDIVPFDEALKFAHIIHLSDYDLPKATEAFERLARTASYERPLIEFRFAMFLMGNGNYKLALDYLERLVIAGHPEAPYNYAICLAELAQFDKLASLDLITRDGQTDVKTIIAATDLPAATKLVPQDRLLNIKWLANTRTIDENIELAESLDGEYKIAAYTDLLEKLYDGSALVLAASKLLEQSQNQSNRIRCLVRLTTFNPNLLTDFTPTDETNKWEKLLMARKAAYVGDTANALDGYLEILKIFSLMPDIASEAISYLYKHHRELDKFVEMLQPIARIHAKDAEVSQAYTWALLYARRFNQADAEAEALSGLMPDDKYLLFQQAYKAKFDSLFNDITF